MRVGRNTPQRPQEYQQKRVVRPRCTDNFSAWIAPDLELDSLEERPLGLPGAKVPLPFEHEPARNLARITWELPGDR